MTHELFQISGKAVLFNKDKSKIVLLRSSAGHLTAPGGHLESGESFEDAVRREIKEEMNIDYNGALTLAYVVRFYADPTTNGKVDVYYVGELDENAPISIENSNGEIVGWEWAPVDKILSGEYTDWLVEIIKEVLK